MIHPNNKNKTSFFTQIILLITIFTTLSVSGNTAAEAVKSPPLGFNEITREWLSYSSPFDETNNVVLSRKEGNSTWKQEYKSGDFQQKLFNKPTAETAKLIATGGTLTGQFGNSVAIDGDTLVIGALSERDELNKPHGAAYIFVRSGTGWMQQAKLTDTEGFPNKFYGISVAISGNTVIIGASGEDFGLNSNKGAAYIYVRNGSNWTLQKKLIAQDGLAGSQFGESVAIDGDTVAIGAVSDRIQNVTQGSAYTFNRVGGDWFEQSKLIDPLGANSDQFGFSIDVKGDTVVVGSRYGDVGTNPAQGSACVFTRNGNVWTHQARLSASDGKNQDQFGFSVALEGNTLVVGATGSRLGSVVFRGSAYIFVKDETGWTQQQKIFAKDDISANFGGSVDISGDNIIIGASLGEPSKGSAYIFVKQGAVWEQQARLLASDSVPGDVFGSAVCVSGSKFIVGAPGADIGSNQNQGAAYYFIKPTSAPDLQSANDTGISNIDNITSSRSLSLNLAGITSGATVELLKNGIVINTAVVSGTTITFNDSNITTDGTFGYSTRQIVGGEVSSESEVTYVTVDTTYPSVTINQTIAQIDPTTGQSVGFAAVFSEPVLDFDISDVSFAGSTAVISGPYSATLNNPTTYFILVNNVSSDGQTVTANIAAGAAVDLAGNVSLASTSTDNTVTVDNVLPKVTINQAIGQTDPTKDQPINFTIVFSEPVINFDASDISLSGSTPSVQNATKVLTGSGLIYNVAVSGLSSNGQFIRAEILAGAVQDAVGNRNEPSTSTDNSVTVDNVAPTVTINQAAGQPDSATPLPINFTVRFSEPVVGFDINDISLAGSTADVSRANIVINGSGLTYNVLIINVASGGQIRASVVPGAVTDIIGNLTSASTSSDNVVTYAPAFVTVSGIVTLSGRRVVGNAQLILTLPSGEQRYAQTNPFGYYRFNNIQTSNVSISITSKSSIGANVNLLILGERSDLHITLQPLH